MVWTAAIASLQIGSATVQLALTPDGGAVIAGLSLNAAGDEDFATIKYLVAASNTKADLSLLRYACLSTIRLPMKMATPRRNGK